MTTDVLASVALAGLTLYALVVLVGRTLLQRRRTGSSGWRGVSGALGSTEWWAGVLIGVSVIAFVATPIAAATGPSAAASPWTLAVGVGLYVVGFAFTVVAQLQMGDSWRIGVQAGEKTTLRTEGVFGWCRNPIFTGMLLTALAMVAWVPWAGLGWVALAVGIELQVRVVEEPHLLQVHGEHYRRYAERTGRFLPGLGRGLPS